MQLPITGLVHVTGEPDTGKTTLSLTVPGVLPSQIIFMDDDKKTQSIADAFAAASSPFGYYVNLERESVQTNQSKPADFYKMVMSHLDKAQKAVQSPQVLVFDNFYRMETAIRAYSMTVMEKISDLTPGQIKGMSQMTWPYTYQIYAQFLDTLNHIAPLVFIITHVREKYMGNVRSGILESQGQKPLSEKANLRIWTRHNDSGPAPVGLVLKRYQRMSVTSEGILPINVLPRKLKPCTWERIIYYLNNPIGDRQPTQEELPTPFELSILDGELTPDQKDAWRFARVQAEKEAAGLDMLPAEDDPNRALAKSYQEAGMTPPQIAKEMSLSVPEVIKLLE